MNINSDQNVLWIYWSTLVCLKMAVECANQVFSSFNVSAVQKNYIFFFLIYSENQIPDVMNSSYMLYQFYNFLWSCGCLSFTNKNDLLPDLPISKLLFLMFKIWLQTLLNGLMASFLSNWTFTSVARTDPPPHSLLAPWTGFSPF